MLHKIQKIQLSTPPKITTSAADFATEMSKFQVASNEKICLFSTSDSSAGKFLLVFAKANQYDQIDMGNVVTFAIEAPCPPYCGDNNGELYVMV